MIGREYGRISPWLGHLMVSRQETARALLTPGEIMQLPSDDEIILVSGAPPIRAQKVRYFRDVQLKARIQTPPNIEGSMPSWHSNTDDWTTLPPIALPKKSVKDKSADDTDGEIRRDPAAIVAGEDATQEAIEQIRVQYGF